MKVTAKTLYDDAFICLEPTFEAGEMERLRKTATLVNIGKDGFYSMTIGDLLRCMDGDFSPLMKHDGTTVFDVYCIKDFSVFCDQFVKMVDSLTLKPTADDSKNARGTKKLTFAESLLIFCRRYFGLHSFADVERLTLADYVIAKKDDYNEQVINRNIANSLKTSRK